MLKFKTLKNKIIIAEIGLSHNGSMSKAKKLIDLTSKSGADVIKFQTHYADEESTIDEKFRKGFNFKHKNRFEYWKAHEFTQQEWVILKKYAKKKRLIFSSSPFSIKAYDILKKAGVDIWKIGSGEFFSNHLNNLILKDKRPIIISTGMCNWKEISTKVKLLKKKKKNFLIMQCTSKYPLNLKEVGMNVISKISKKYNCPVGLSDHSGSISPSLMALSDDITKVIEVHVSEPKNFNNPDRASSISFEQLKLICEHRDNLKILKKNNIDKDKMSKQLLKTRELFTKSIAVKKNLKIGKVILLNDLCFKKPGNGIKESKINNILGKKLIKNVNYNKLLKWTDLEK
jgi:N,N'-diacetyllegionaminate synthase